MLILNFDGKYMNYVEVITIYVTLLYFRQKSGKKIVAFMTVYVNFVFYEEIIELC